MSEIKSDFTGNGAGLDYDRKELFGGRNSGESKLQMPSDYSAALRKAHESILIGQGTVQQLEEQYEKLDRSAMVIESTKYILEKSERIIRGMSVWGKIQNFFTDAPAIPESKCWTTQDVIKSGFICPECMLECASSEILALHYESLHGKNELSNENLRYNGLDQETYSKLSIAPRRDRIESGNSVLRAQRQKMLAQEEYIMTLSTSILPQLSRISNDISLSLDNQDRILEQLETSTDAAKDAALLVTRKATRKIDGKPVHIGVVAFFCERSQQFVELDGTGTIVLGGNELSSRSLWEHHESKNGICGLKSKVSGLWLGVTVFGNLSCSATKLGVNEQWQWDIIYRDGNTPYLRLINCSSGWGKGGYLVVHHDGQISIARCSEASKAIAVELSAISINPEAYISSQYAAASKLKKMPIKS